MPATLNSPPPSARRPELLLGATQGRAVPRLDACPAVSKISLLYTSTEENESETERQRQKEGPGERDGER